MSLRNAFSEVSTEDSLSVVKRILKLLRPLGIVTGAGSNRLSVDINNITGGNLGTVTTVTTVSTVTAVAAVTNQVNMGGVTAFDLMKAMSRTAYNTGPRSKLS